MKPMLLVLLALTMLAASACVVVPAGPDCCYGGPVVYGGYGRGDWHGEGWRR